MFRNRWKWAYLALYGAVAGLTLWLCYQLFITEQVFDCGLVWMMGWGALWFSVTEHEHPLDRAWRRRRGEVWMESDRP